MRVSEIILGFHLIGIGIVITNILIEISIEVLQTFKRIVVSNFGGRAYALHITVLCVRAVVEISEIFHQQRH